MAVAPAPDVEPSLEVTQFSDESNDSTFHFQILRLTNQLYVWIGCNSARMGNLYAALPTRWDKTASVAALVGGGADSTGASMARRLSMRTGWSIVLASNIPSNAPVLEAFAEQRLFQELRSMGYIKPASKPLNGPAAPLAPI
ncbi:uncharacterized protein [Physcomitrium patens]|uniref:Proteasome assembly chaperone 4 n=1 Tax=Physcomitrium patens TaxID=3218 RepID=A9SGZ2_PHYPA|nr:proteasome assembly chaperone 4-like [Physcomitrium patens]XP_024384832.1 proteasome assembly chaperone 4-like [Physcomitrium patens]PNR48354.1 hypothetical protein PHYPA_012830 [Physcomitrium patens]|eukprot:XP_024384831.1 proteasome assembly chaperone 4-like [Physcomitrella patens]